MPTYIYFFTFICHGLMVTWRVTRMYTVFQKGTTALLSISSILFHIPLHFDKILSESLSPARSAVNLQSLKTYPALNASLHYQWNINVRKLACCERSGLSCWKMNSPETWHNGRQQLLWQEEHVAIIDASDFDWRTDKYRCSPNLTRRLTASVIAVDAV